MTHHSLFKSQNGKTAALPAVSDKGSIVRNGSPRGNAASWTFADYAGTMRRVTAALNANITVSASAKA